MPLPYRRSPRPLSLLTDLAGLRYLPFLLVLPHDPFLTLNLLFCSARHFPVAWRRFREGSLGARKVRDYREDTCHSPLSPADIPERLNTLLRRIHYRPHLSAPEDHKLRATAGLIFSPGGLYRS